MQPLLNAGYAYEKPKAYVYQKITRGDAKFSAVPIMGKPPSPPPTENADPPGEPFSKADEATQDGGKGGDPAASNEVTPESTGLLSLPPLK